MLKEKNYQLRILYSVKISLKNEGEIRTFSGEQKLRNFIVSIPTLPEILKEILQSEEKWYKEESGTSGVKEEQ